MDNWQVAQGSTATFTITINDGAGVPVSYAGTEALAGAVWAGDDQAPLFALAPAWATPASGTATVAVPGASTAALAVGTYRVRVTVDGADAFYATLELGYSPGTAVAPPTYNTYQDMLDLAPWVAQVQQLDADEAGFLAARARARCEIDDAIVASYRGSSIGLFGTQSLAAMDWAGGGPRRTTRPSQVIRSYLQSDFLMCGRDPSALAYRPKVAKMAAYRAISIVGLKQAGLNQQHAAQGAMFYRMFLAELSTYVAELDINGDGLCEIPIPCGVTNTLFT